jgi:hypothetical protein
MRLSALLMASVHGIASLEISGHLTEEKWHTDTARHRQLLRPGRMLRRGMAGLFGRWLAGQLAGS